MDECRSPDGLAEPSHEEGRPSRIDHPEADPDPGESARVTIPPQPGPQVTQHDKAGRKVSDEDKPDIFSGDDRTPGGPEGSLVPPTSIHSVDDGPDARTSDREVSAGSSGDLPSKSETEPTPPDSTKTCLRALTNSRCLACNLAVLLQVNLW